MLSPHRPDRQRSRAATWLAGVLLRRCVLSLVALCVVFQGVMLTAERTLGRAHVHFDVASLVQQPLAELDGGADLHAGHLGDLDGHRYIPEIATDMAADATEPVHDHHHASPARHDHDAAVESVAYLAEDDGASSLNPNAGSSQGIRDLYGMVPAFDVPVAAARAVGWAGAGSRRFESQITPPLERPPRA